MNTKNPSNYCVRYPNIIAILGIMDSCISVIFIIVSIIPLDKQPDYLTLFIFIVFLLLGCYLFFKGHVWKITVNGNFLIEHKALGYNYTFSLSDIEKVRRQTKKTHNRIKEQLIIITLHGEKIVVEDFACGYFLLKKTIEDEIESSRLEGFDKK